MKRMERNFATDALILSCKNVGEDHRLITIFTKDKGIISAMQFGGRKSKLRAMVQIFHSGKIWLYHDPVKDQMRITDFDVISFRPSLRENLDKNWAANLCLELVQKTHCGADNENGFILVNAFLDGLDFSKPEETAISTFRFLWRFLALLGQQPDIRFCSKCANPLNTHGIFSLRELEFVCNNCKIPNDKEFILCGECLNFLKMVNTLPPKESRKITLSEKAQQELNWILFQMTEKLLDIKLKTLNIIIK